MMIALASLAAGHHLAIAIARHLYPDTSAFQAHALPVRVRPRAKSDDSSAGSRRNGKDLHNRSHHSQSLQMSALPGGLSHSQPRGIHREAAAALPPAPGQVVPHSAHSMQPGQRSSAWDEEAQLYAGEQGARGTPGRPAHMQPAPARPTQMQPAPGQPPHMQPDPGQQPDGVNASSGRADRDEGQAVMAEEEEDLGVQEEGPRGADMTEEEGANGTPGRPGHMQPTPGGVMGSNGGADIDEGQAVMREEEEDMGSEEEGLRGASMAAEETEREEDAEAACNDDDVIRALRCIPREPHIKFDHIVLLHDRIRS